MTGFVVERLASRDSHLVYPIVRAALPGVSFAAWRAFTRRTARPSAAAREGIVIARRTARRFPCGLLCYRVDNDMEHGMVLTAEHVIALDILDPRPVLRALLAELDMMAATRGCNVVRSFAHHGCNDVTASLNAAGHHPDRLRLEKSLFRPVSDLGQAPRSDPGGGGDARASPGGAPVRDAARQ